MTATLQKWLNKMIVPAVILCLSLLFFVKLDYEYYFTDEILYLNSGREYLLKSDYTLNLQHPFLAKYIVGAASLINQRNVFVLRFPFALMGAFSCLAVYFILYDYLKRKTFSLAGSIIYFSAYYLFETTRMSMMESPMHLFWLLFALYFFRFLRTRSLKNSILCGIFLGLSTASKFNALVILLPAFISFIMFARENKLPLQKFKNIFYIFGGFIAAFFLTYMPLVIARGLNGITDVIRAIKDILFERNSEGKTHVVGDAVYTKSPWWYYFYYINRNYNLSQKIVFASSPFSLFIERGYFSIFWAVLFAVNAVLFSMVSLKNPRYIASMELPLVFLSTLLLKYVYEKYHQWILYFVVSALFLSQTAFIFNLQKTSYSALYDFLKTKTDNFSKNDRTYILGSIRSSRWYFEGAPEDLIVSRKDFTVMGPEFPNFKYLVVEDSEEIKNPENELSVFIRANYDKYQLIKVPELSIYERK